MFMQSLRLLKFDEQSMINNPEIQMKAHAELDSYCGEDHLPTWKDEKNLPYIRMGALSFYVQNPSLTHRFQWSRKR